MILICGNLLDQSLQILSLIPIYSYPYLINSLILIFFFLKFSRVILNLEISKLCRKTSYLKETYLRVSQVLNDPL